MAKENTILNMQAYRAYQVVKYENEESKRQIIDSLNCFQYYLSDLYSQVSKKSLSEKFIIDWIYKIQVANKDFDSFCKANIAAASSSLSRVIKHIEDIEVDEVLQRMLLDFICDLKLFVTHYDKSQDYSWLVINTNSHITNFYFDLADNIFWHGKPSDHKEEQLVLATSSPFIIRQSIEIKIKRVLGIQYVLKNGKLDKTPSKVFFNAFKNNLIYYRLRNFDIETIEKIHSWAHFYVHGGLRAEPWRTETALYYLNRLNYKGPTSDSRTMSIYASVEANEVDLVDLNAATEESIKNDLGNDVSIKWVAKPEIAVIKSK